MKEKYSLKSHLQEYSRCKSFTSIAAGMVSCIALILVFSVPAFALNAVLSGKYQIQLITEPDPPNAGSESVLTFKILHLADMSPARAGRVLVDINGKTADIKDNILDLDNVSSYIDANEVDEHGNYEIRTTFLQPDNYYFKLKISEIDGSVLDPPITAGFALEVAPGGDSGIGLWVVFLVIAGFTVLAIYGAHIKRKIISTDREAFNLLDIPWIRRLLIWKYLQPASQVVLLIGFIVLIYLAFFDIQDGGRNLSTKLVWTIWWAAVIFTFVLVGRLWCYMCPVGAVSEWTSRAVKSDRKIPRALRNVWIANLLFLILTWLDIQLGVVRTPVVTGTLFVLLTLTAITTAIFYERRTFCRYLCPIGGLIGLYSMFSPVELRSKDCGTCREHTKKECYLGNDNGRGCPMFEIIPTMDSNNACNFCGECVKSCSRDNITLRFRAFFKDAWTTKKRRLDEAVLAIVLVGVSIFVTGDMLEPWAGWMETAKGLVPAEALGIEYDYTVEVIAKSVLFFGISLVLIPAMMVLAAYVSNVLVGRENSPGLKNTFVTFGYMFIPVGLSMHLAHNMGHLFKESMGVVPAFQRAVSKYTTFNTGEPNWQMGAMSLIDASFLYWLQMFLLMGFYTFALYAGYRLSLNNYKDRNVAFRAFVPMAVLSFILIIANVYLLNLPMAPRHVH